MNMRKMRITGLCAAAILALAVGFVLAADMPKEAGKQVTMNGWITDSFCTSKPGAEKDKDCVLKCVEKGAKLVLLVPDSKKSYSLDDQKMAKENVGHEVKVTGTLDEATQSIKVNKIEAAKMEPKKG